MIFKRAVGWALWEPASHFSFPALSDPSASEASPTSPILACSPLVSSTFFVFTSPCSTCNQVQHPVRPFQSVEMWLLQCQTWKLKTPAVLHAPDLAQLRQDTSSTCSVHHESVGSRARVQCPVRCGGPCCTIAGLPCHRQQSQHTGPHLHTRGKNSSVHETQEAVLPSRHHRGIMDQQ